MSATKSTVTCIASGSPRTTGRPLSAGDFLSPVFMNTADNEMLDRFNRRFRSDNSDISLEKFSEIRVFYEFLAHHVEPNRVCDVQCMRLWSEWVRLFQRRTNDFPKQVLEQEFSSTIGDIFGVSIAKDGSRGTIYPGLRFVP